MGDEGPASPASCSAPPGGLLPNMESPLLSAVRHGDADGALSAVQGGCVMDADVITALRLAVRVRAEAVFLRLLAGAPVVFSNVTIFDVHLPTFIFKIFFFARR